MKPSAVMFCALIGGAGMLLPQSGCNRRTGQKPPAATASPATGPATVASPASTVPSTKPIPPSATVPSVAVSLETQPAPASATTSRTMPPMARGAIEAVAPIEQAWEIRTIGDGGDLLDVAFLDARTGVILGSDGSIHSTADAGRTWTQAAPPAGGPAGPASLLLDGRSIAYALTRSPDSIRRSTDGGRTWHRLPLPSGSPGILQHALSMGEYVVRTSGYVLHRWTETGGWKRAARLPGGAYTDLAFPHRRHGYAVAGGAFPHVAVTSDGGQTWLKTRLDGVGGAALRVQFVNDQVGYVLPDYGPLLATTDAGRSWAACDVGQGAGRTLAGLHFEDERTGYVVSTAEDAGLYVQRTNDGGATWEPLPALKPAGRVRGFTFSATGTGWAVGEGGLVARLRSDGEGQLAKE